MQIQSDKIGKRARRSKAEVDGCNRKLCEAAGRVVGGWKEGVRQKVIKRCISRVPQIITPCKAGFL